MTMKFDHIIGNPPYHRHLHLDILQEEIKHCDNDIVWLHPIEQYISRRLVFDRNGLLNAKNNDFTHFESVTEVENLFDACIGNTLGISHIIMNKTFDTSYDRFVKGDKALIKKLGSKVKECNLLQCPKDKKFVMNISPIHGNVGKETWLYILPKTYERALQVKDHNISSQHCNPTFDTDEERKNFYDSTFLKLHKYIVKCWKTDIRVIYKYLPWLSDYTHPWTDEMLYEYFDLTEDEIKEIESEIKVEQL